MTPAVEQLVRETMELTGAPTPQLLEDGAPVLADEALEVREADDRDGGDFSYSSDCGSAIGGRL